MKIEIKAMENFSSFFMRVGIPFVPRSLRVHVQLYKTPEAWVHGYSSRTEQGRYVLFHDYDNLEIEDIVEELKWLQERFRLSNYYIFKLPDKENSFHAVCLDTFTLNEAYDIQKATSCDLAFIHAIKNLKSKEWILRLTKKGARLTPEFLKTIVSRYGKKVKSQAHAKFLRKIGIKVPKTGKWDGGKKIGVVKYNTANRIERT